MLLHKHWSINFSLNVSLLRKKGTRKVFQFRQLDVSNSSQVWLPFLFCVCQMLSLAFKTSLDVSAHASNWIMTHDLNSHLSWDFFSGVCPSQNFSQLAKWKFVLSAMKFWKLFWQNTFILKKNILSSTDNHIFK